MVLKINYDTVKLQSHMTTS